MGLKELRQSEAWKSIGEIADVHWISTLAVPSIGALIAAKAASVLGKPLYIVLLVGFAGFAFLMVAVHFGWKIIDRLREKYRWYDVGTLKGRALKLRDEMQKFLDSAPLATKPTRDMTSEEILATAFTDPRAPKLRHGYHLRFEARVVAIYHEFGEYNVEQNQLLRQGFIREEDYTDVIQALTDLSGRPEAKLRTRPHLAL